MVKSTLAGANENVGLKHVHKKGKARQVTPKKARTFPYYNLLVEMTAYGLSAAVTITHAVIVPVLARGALWQKMIVVIDKIRQETGLCG